MSRFERLSIGKLPLVLVAVLLCLFAYSIQGQVKASLSVVSITEHESVTLTIEDESGDSGEPNFDALVNDFELSNLQSASQFEFINGNFRSLRSWKVMLYPKRTGLIQIPPFDIGGNRSNSLTLDVRPLSLQERTLVNRTAFFETKVSHSEQYLQAAIYVTRSMFYTAQTRIPSIPEEKPLEVDNAVVRALGSRESTREIRDGVDYYVMTWRYVIFPEKSGQLRIPGESTRVAMYGNNQRPVVRSIIAEDTLVNILPIPAEYPVDKPWLPASNVFIEENYDPAFTGLLIVGDALTRTITVSAENSFDAALSPLDLGSIVNLRIYPEQPRKETILQNQIVWATQERTFNLIPIETGTVTLPEFTLTWWDVESKQVRTSTLGSAAISVPEQVGSALESHVASATDQASAIGQTFPEASFHTSNVWFYVLGAVAILGWLAVFALLLRNRMNGSNSPAQQEQPALADSPTIRTAFATNDASQLRAAILATVARRLDIDSVQAAVELRKTGEGRTLIEKLDRQAYGQDYSAFDFDYRNIKQLIDNMNKDRDEVESSFSLQTVLN